MGVHFAPHSKFLSFYGLVILTLKNYWELKKKSRERKKIPHFHIFKEVNLPRFLFYLMVIFYKKKKIIKFFCVI